MIHLKERQPPTCTLYLLLNAYQHRSFLGTGACIPVYTNSSRVDTPCLKAHTCDPLHSVHSHSLKYCYSSSRLLITHKMSWPHNTPLKHCTVIFLSFMLVIKYKKFVIINVQCKIRHTCTMVFTVQYIFFIYNFYL